MLSEPMLVTNSGSVKCTARAPSRQHWHQRPRLPSEQVWRCFWPYSVRPALIIPIVAAGSLVCLAVLGAVAARVGGAKMAVGAARVTFWGVLAMAATAGDRDNVRDGRLNQEVRGPRSEVQCREHAPNGRASFVERQAFVLRARRGPRSEVTLQCTECRSRKAKTHSTETPRAER